MTSPYGKRFSLARAARFLDVSDRALRRLVRERRIVHHRDSAPVSASKVGRPASGGEIFFYERELLDYIERTRIEALSTPPLVDGDTAAFIDRQVQSLLPSVRRFA